MALKGHRNRRPSTTQEQYLNDISRILEDVINAESVSNESRVKTVLVSQTPIKAQTEDAPLYRRHSVEIINDSSYLIYFGFSENMQVGVDTLLVNSGSSITISLNPYKPADIWVVSPDLDTEIKIVEVS